MFERQSDKERSRDESFCPWFTLAVALLEPVPGAPAGSAGGVRLHVGRTRSESQVGFKPALRGVWASQSQAGFKPALHGVWASQAVADAASPLAAPQFQIAAILRT